MDLQHGTRNNCRKSNRINQAKEAQRQQRIKARKKQDEIMETLKWVAYTFIGVGVLMLLLLLGVRAFADGYIKSKDYTRQQKRYGREKYKKENIQLAD